VIVDFRPPLRARRPPRRHALRTLVAAAALVLAGWGLAGGVGGVTGSAAAVTVVVHPGDTLWGIAAEHYPGDDIRQQVTEIMQLNRLTSVTIQPGERLVLPGA
jgi:nucleoid-associated protein YgaU